MISFRLVYVTANTRITVSGIERKTITVTYNENALDHVSNLPAPRPRTTIFIVTGTTPSHRSGSCPQRLYVPRLEHRWQRFG